MRRWTDTGVAGWLGGRTDGLGRDSSTVTHSCVTLERDLTSLASVLSSVK